MVNSIHYTTYQKLQIKLEKFIVRHDFARSVEFVQGSNVTQATFACVVINPIAYLLKGMAIKTAFVNMSLIVGHLKQGRENEEVKSVIVLNTVNLSCTKH